MEIAEYCERMTGKPITEWQRRMAEEIARNPNRQIVMPKGQKIQKNFCFAKEIRHGETS